MKKSVQYWFLGCLVSLFLLVLFMVLQSLYPATMQLGAHWVAASFLPLILYLFAGGVITSFNGMGIELKRDLNNPISGNLSFFDDSIRSNRSEINTRMIAQKGGLRDLRQVSFARRKDVKVLQFRLKSRGDFDPSVLKDYISAFPDLRYLEIVDRLGTSLVGYMPVSALWGIHGDFPESEGRHMAMQDFCVWLNDPEKETVFNHMIFKEVVSENEAFSELVKRLNYGRGDAIGLVDRDRKYRGLVFKEDLFNFMADRLT